MDEKKLQGLVSKMESLLNEVKSAIGGSDQPDQESPQESGPGDENEVMDQGSSDLGKPDMTAKKNMFIAMMKKKGV